MSYAVHFFRDIVITGDDYATNLIMSMEQEMIFNFWGFTITPLVSVFILVVFGAIFLFLSTLTFTKVDFSKMNRNKVDAVDMWS